jgi:hypothetical protein
MVAAATVHDDPEGEVTEALMRALVVLLIGATIGLCGAYWGRIECDPMAEVATFISDY